MICCYDFETRNKFYRTNEWKNLRREFLRKTSNRFYCSNCSLFVGIEPNVEHILPIKYFWEKRLDMSNLQLLCQICNKV